KCAPGELYLVGSEAKSQVHTFRQALEKLIAKSTTKGIRWEQDKRYVRPTQVPRLICDASKFVKRTGWKPKLSFETILDETLAYWRDQLDRKLVN
ncbi:MAG: GDP-mannose 4,6-dehydratase, partial [Elusimicrobia bacterium]|nr:GDP-mannose 4,6-dehydratase [Elusimicrobiota bacterium]